MKYEKLLCDVAFRIFFITFEQQKMMKKMKAHLVLKIHENP